MSDLSRVSRNYKKCVVCNKRRIPGSNVYLARIPLDPDRCRMWLKAIGLVDLVYLPIEKLHQLKFVCNIHFKQEDFNASYTRLKEHAVPTLNLPLKPLQDAIFHDFPLHIGQYPRLVLGKGSQIDHGNLALLNQVETVSQPEAHDMGFSTSTSSQHVTSCK